jgi:pentatricopeptide repeat protein
VTLALRPDTVLYGSLLHACRESWEIAVMLLEEMCHERINRDLICFNAALSALATAGRWQEALRLMRRMERFPAQNVANWVNHPVGLKVRCFLDH